jgi:magnesium-transporting ATPase (P-type)
VQRRSRRGRSGHIFPFHISGRFLSSTHVQEENKDRENLKATDNQASPGQNNIDGATPTIEENQNALKNDSDSDTHPTLLSETYIAEESLSVSFLRMLFSGGILCSKCVLGDNGGSKGEIGNPTELSILRAAYFAGVNVQDMKASSPIIAEVPFSSEYKFMATVHHPVELNDGNFMGSLIVHVKGAPDRLLPCCKLQSVGGSIQDVEPCDNEYWLNQIAILSSHGLRVLALTRGTVPKESVADGEQLGPDFITGQDEPWLTLIGLVRCYSGL